MHIDRRKDTLRKKYQDAKIYCLPSKTRFPPGPIVVAIGAAASQQSSRDLVGESVAFVVAKFWCKNDELDGWIWCCPSLQNSDANDELAWREGMARSCLFSSRVRVRVCVFFSLSCVSSFSRMPLPIERYPLLYISPGQASRPRPIAQNAWRSKPILSAGR
jgi:hypothetical protein